MRLANPLIDEGFAGVFGRQLPRPWTNKIERVFLDSTYLDASEVRVCPEQRAFGIRDIFFSNVCYAIRRDVWERIPFDESLIMSEDQLWAKQALLASHQLLCEPSAQVFHLHNYGLRDFFRRNFDSGVSLVGIAQATFANMVSYEGRHAVWCASEVAPSSFDYQHRIRGGITTHKVSRTQLHQWLPVAGGFFSQVFYYPPLRYVNENASEESKILMIGSQMGYDLQRFHIADTTWESTPWRRLLLKADTPEGVRDEMKAEGITHVIYSPELYVFSTNTGSLGIASADVGSGRPDYYEQWRNWTTFEEFKAKYLEQIYKDQPGRYTVFLLR